MGMIVDRVKGGLPGATVDRVKEVPMGATVDRVHDAPMSAAGGVGGGRSPEESPAAGGLADPGKEAVAKGVGADRGTAGVSVARQLVRGVVGFGAIAGAFALVPVVGPAALLLAPVGLIALRGCPTCWLMGLIQAVSAGRMARRCVDGRCEVRSTRPGTGRPPSARPAPGVPGSPAAGPKVPNTSATGDEATTHPPDGTARNAA
jgi:hypothetical protein